MKSFNGVLLLFGLFIFSLMISEGESISADNICTFYSGDKLFSLLYLDQKQGYELEVDSENSIFFNFCSDFTPPSCQQEGTTTAYAFLAKKTSTPITNHSQSFDKTQDNSTSQGNQEDNKTDVIDDNEAGTNQSEENINQVLVHGLSLVDADIDDSQGEGMQCIRYSSNSYVYYFKASYIKAQKLGTLHLILNTEKDKQLTSKGVGRSTEFIIQCSDYEGLDIEGYSVTEQKITIQANSFYGCPAFEVSNIWAVFSDNQLLFGVILLVLGLYMLFYGRVTIQVTIFVGAFFISLAIVGSIFTVFVSPYSSTFVMYFSFLLLLTICTLLAYGVSRLVNISIFFVGAFLGFIIAMLVNSIFCKMTDIYSVWSFVIFVIFFTIPFGVLTFKYRDQILIASSSLTGAYLVIRPISWIFGGFPNQFLLYHLIETNQLDTLPWSFFGYLILIVALALIGSMYQLLKFYRQNPDDQIETNGIQDALEEPMDNIKQKVDKLVHRFKSDDSGKQYRKMKQMKDKPRNQMKEDDQ